MGKAQNRLVPRRAASESRIVAAEDCIGQIITTAQDMDWENVKELKAMR